MDHVYPCHIQYKRQYSGHRMKPLDMTMIRKTPYPLGPSYYIVKGLRVYRKPNGSIRFRGCSRWHFGCNCESCREAQRYNRQAEVLERMAQEKQKDRLGQIVGRPNLPILYHLRSRLATSDTTR